MEGCGKLVPGRETKFSEIGSLFGGAFGGAQFVDEAVHILLADALAVGFRAAVGVDIVPPRTSFVMAEGLAYEFAHGSALLLGYGLGTLQRVGREGHGKPSGVPHGDVVKQDLAVFYMIVESQITSMVEYLLARRLRIQVGCVGLSG